MGCYDGPMGIRDTPDIWPTIAIYGSILWFNRPHTLLFPGGTSLFLCDQNSQLTASLSFSSVVLSWLCSPQSSRSHVCCGIWSVTFPWDPAAFDLLQALGPGVLRLGWQVKCRLSETTYSRTVWYHVHVNRLKLRPMYSDCSNTIHNNVTTIIFWCTACAYNFLRIKSQPCAYIRVFGHPSLDITRTTSSFNS